MLKFKLIRIYHEIEMAAAAGITLVPERHPLDATTRGVGEGGQALSKMAFIDTSNADPRLNACTFQVACDVNNPLCGENGATYIYGPQKGVTDDLKVSLDLASFQRYLASERSAICKTSLVPS